MSDRPGFMVYFELVPAIATMEDLEAGRLLKALMAYARYGEIVELQGIAAFAFEIMRPRIDKDAERYAEKCRKSAYSVYLREARRRQEVPLEYEEWCRCGSDDIQRYPTQHNTNSSTNSNTNSNTNTNSKNKNKNNNSFFLNGTPEGVREATASGGTAAGNADTDWVLAYLEENRQKRQGGTICGKQQTG